MGVSDDHHKMARFFLVFFIFIFYYLLPGTLVLFLSLHPYFSGSGGGGVVLSVFSPVFRSFSILFRALPNATGNIIFVWKPSPNKTYKCDT